MFNSITTSIQLLILCLHLVKAAKIENFVPNTFVIEFDRPIHSFASKRHVLGKRSLFYEQLNAQNISYDVRHEYEVINAVSLAFKTPQDSALFFEKAIGVKKAWPVVLFSFSAFTKDVCLLKAISSLEYSLKTFSVSSQSTRQQYCTFFI